jgi:hypothetical protein
MGDADWRLSDVAPRHVLARAPQLALTVARDIERPATAAPNGRVVHPLVFDIAAGPRAGERT